jgi:hypothetical protein
MVVRVLPQSSPSTGGVTALRQVTSRDQPGGGDMPSELTTEEKLWCLEQAIALAKEAGHGGASNMRDTASILQEIYRVLYTVRQGIKDDA